MILSQLTDRRSHLRLHYSLPTEGASGFRTARRSLVLLATQSQAPDSQATQLKVDAEIHALCEALIASERQPEPHQEIHLQTKCPRCCPVCRRTNQKKCR